MAGVSLAGQVVVVTGGAGGDVGIGLSLTEALARVGASVAVWDRNPEAIERARLELNRNGLRADFREVDVADQEQVAAAYQWVRDTLGAVDTLINNAALKMDFMLGQSREKKQTIPFWQLDLGRFRRALDVNVVGPFITCSTVAPEMVTRGRGSIVNVVTSPQTLESPRHIPYGPSKAMLQAMTKAMARQLEGTGVQVNAVLPGGAVNYRGKNEPALSPWDAMVAPVLWLASNASQGTTGQVFTGTEFLAPK